MPHTWTGLEDVPHHEECDGGESVAREMEANLREMFRLWRQEIKDGLALIQRGIKACDPQTADAVDTIADLRYFVKRLEDLMDGYEYAIREIGEAGK